MLPPLIALATLVFCAPGYPGAPEDAQPLLDAFVQAVTRTAHWPAASLDAVYDPTEAGGVQKLSAAGAALALVPYPFYFAHARELRLTPELEADVEGVGTEERWTLVAPRGKVAGPAAMAGYTLVSVAGYAPEFVRHVALPEWPLPPSVHIVASEQVLTMLRRSASGEPLAVLLDAQETTALASLPFAAQLQQVARSPALPVAVLARVGQRLPPARIASLRTALLALPRSPGGADALAGLRLKGFVPVHLPAGAP